MTVTTEMIKQLRESTGVGILDCRTALEESNGDFEKAVELLREKVWLLPVNEPGVKHWKES